MDNFDLYGIDDDLLYEGEPDPAPEVGEPDPWMMEQPERGLLDAEFDL